MELTPPRLRQLRDQLAASFAPVDAELLAAGEQLAAAIGRLDGIREGLSALRDTMQRPDIAAATASLDTAAAQVGALCAGLEAEAAGIATLEARLGEVGACIGRLLAVNRGLTQLSLNSAVVSSGIAGEGGDILNFAAEIRSLLKSAEEVMRGYGRAQHGALRELRLVGEAQDDFRRRQGGLLRDVAARIACGLGELSARQREAAEAASDLQDRAGRVAAAIGVTVASLQVGDATRQRIEHVVDGVDALAAGLAGVPRPWCEGLARPEREALAWHGAALQAALLRGAGTAFGTEVARISAALAQLGADARGMVDSGAALFGRGDATAGSFLSALERDLGLATRLLAEASARRRQADAAMATIGGMMATLRDGLEAVSNAAIDLRLVGLNAAFRCARLGPRGVALAAIARELRAQAAQMAEGVQALSAAVVAALQAGAEIRTASEVAQAEALAGTTAAMQGSLDVLRTAGGAMDGAIGRLGEDGRQVADALTAMSAGIAAVAQLRGLLEAAAEALDRGLPGEASAAPALLRARLGLLHAVPFTMAAEREIARAHGVELPEPAAAAEALDDLLF